MDSNIVTLIIGLAGISATLISSSLGLYFTAKARRSPLRELIYSKQLDLISTMLHKQGRISVFIVLLLGDDPEIRERAREDMRIVVKELSELGEEATAIFPTNLWLEAKRLLVFVLDFLVKYDEQKPYPEDIKEELSARLAKVALIARAVLGVDELTEESLRLFAKKEDFERLAELEIIDFKEIYKNEKPNE
jgi:hypothetical protein